MPDLPKTDFGQRIKAIGQRYPLLTAVPASEYNYNNDPKPRDFINALNAQYLVSQPKPPSTALVPYVPSVFVAPTPAALSQASRTIQPNRSKEPAKL